MDKRSRDIIHKYKPILSDTISYEKIEMFVKNYKIFTRAMFDDIFGPNSERNFYDELCTRGPHAFSNFLEILKDANYYKIANVLRGEMNNNQFPIYYKMDSKPFIGYCLIIMNQDFDGVLEYREGCEVDADALKKLFEKLKYDVRIEWNKKKNEMISILKEFSQKSEFEKVDSCIVYILSHGCQFENREFIWSSDNRRVFKSDIYSIFNNENCKLLIGKPKMFFFQACRGKRLDSGVNKNSCTQDTSDNTCANNNTCDDDNNVKCQNFPDFTDNSSLKFDKAKIDESKFPSCSDMFIVHSSLPDHKSWKNDRKGSWLCQDLVSVINEYYDKYDLATMMTFVNSKQMNRESEDGYKQVSEFGGPGIAGLIQFKRSE